MSIEHTNGTNGKQAAHELADDRRQWPRIASDLAEITIVSGTGMQTASVIDESFGGIGIKVREIGDIVRGHQLKLLYCNIPVLGVVRRVQPDVEAHRVGVEWLDARRDEMSKLPGSHKRTAQYLCFSGFRVACRVGDSTATGVRVVLPDGSSCDVKAAEVLTRTIDERKLELDSLTLDLTMLAGVYQLGRHASKAARVEAILDYEFERNNKTVGDLLEQLRQKNKTILDQSQRIEELEAIVGCFVHLNARVKELEMDASH